MNVITQEKYIGSTTNFPRRKRHHISDLELKKARSKRFQEAFDKHGKQSFVFFPLERFETADQDYRYEREQFWIDQYNPEYNVNKIAGSYFSESARTEEAKRKSVDKRRGRKQPESEKENRRQSLIRFYSDPANHKPLSEERKQHLSKINTGEGNPNWGTKRTDKFRKTISNVNSTTEYTFLSPHGEKVVLRNLLKNGEQHTGLKYWELRKLYQGKKQIIKGWTIIGFKKDR